MDDVVATGDYETVSNAIRKYIINNLEESRREGIDPEHLYIELLHAALKYDDERLDIVACVCIKMIPSGLLGYYVMRASAEVTGMPVTIMYDIISWKVAQALTKVYDIDRELLIVDNRYISDNPHTIRGRGRLFYLNNSDL